nr:hypothetical protein [uncultured Carboxylicivirga sp.]
MTLFNYDNLIKEFKKRFFHKCVNIDTNTKPVEALFYTFTVMKFNYFGYLIISAIVLFLQLQIIIQFIELKDEISYIIPLATFLIFMAIYLWKFKNYSIYNIIRLSLRLEALKKTYLANELLNADDLFDMVKSNSRGESAKRILAKAYYEEHYNESLCQLEKKDKETHMIAFHWMAGKMLNLSTAKSDHGYFFATILGTGDDHIANYGTILNKVTKIDGNSEKVKGYEKVQKRLDETSELLINYAKEIKVIAKKTYNPN